jgi:hypothetical protein
MNARFLGPRMFRRMVDAVVSEDAHKTNKDYQPEDLRKELEVMNLDVRTIHESMVHQCVAAGQPASVVGMLL